MTSIVEYFAEHEGYKCGYCKGTDTNYSHGLWAHTMSVVDYQDLIDRGWRRSGKYCYKPTMDKTCCPQYTIKCHALDFKPTKSHKKVLKRFRNYLWYGRKRGDAANADGDDVSDVAADEVQDEIEARNISTEAKLQLDQATVAKAKQSPKRNRPELRNACDTAPSEQNGDDSVDKSLPVPGAGPDPNKPKQRKAKTIRLERKRKKMEDRGMEDTTTTSKNKNKEKSLEDFISELSADPVDGVTRAHSFETRLVFAQTSDQEFCKSYQESFKVYKQYQVSVHGDPPAKVTSTQFKRFLCDASLEPRPVPGGPSHGLGGYHQQYIIDGKIVCVGVLDVLPNCVSSVYLYYDPAFAFLSLGTLSSLFEIHFVRSLHNIIPRLKYYYMGFYIHSCPKMRYKGKYLPSSLLCPETYTWVDIGECTPKLDASPYARLTPDPTDVDVNAEVDYSRLLVLFDGNPMTYETYRRVSEAEDVERETEEVKQYAGFVGNEVAARMLLFRAEA